MKTQLSKNKPISRLGLAIIAIFFLSLLSFGSYSQTIQPPAGTTPPPNQIPRTPPETQPAPSQNYPGSRHMPTDTVKHLKKDTTQSPQKPQPPKPDSLKRIPPPHK